MLNLELIERLLKLQNTVHLLTATRGDRGSGNRPRRRPDVILLDVHLPDMDGAEVLCKRCAANPRRQTLPVVIVSADAMGESDRTDANGLGAQAYVTKPIDIDALRRTIHETLARPAVMC